MSDCSGRGLKKTFLLPFATPASGRFKDFTKDMERAAILYLAESNREKSEGHILKKPSERLAFITEAWYPLLIIPSEGGALLFDGLGITSHTMPYDTVPNIGIFNNDIRESKKTTEAYAATLLRNIDYFREFGGKEEKAIEGLIANPLLMRDFKAHFTQMKEIQEPLANGVVLPTLIEDNEVRASVDQFTDLRKRIEEDVEDIDRSMRLLSTATAERTKMILEEIDKTREESNREIEKLKPKVTRKILEAQDRYRKEITRSSRQLKTRCRNLSKNQARLQKYLKHLKTEAKKCETRIKSNKRKKRKRIETQWKLKLKRIKKNLTTQDKELKETIKKTREVEAAQKLESVQLKAEYNAAIEQAEEPIHTLESFKEAEITAKQQEIVLLENATFRIASQMRKMAEEKRAVLTQFGAVTMPRRGKTPALVYVPFYLVRYEKEDRKRFAIYSPSTVSDMKILTRMKGVLGATKMRTLLQPRSEATARFLTRLLALIDRKPMFEKEITEASMQTSILSARRVRMTVKKGLEELKREEWMSKNELQTFSNLLYVYA